MLNNTLKLTRQKLYDEIWTLSVSGTSKKYDIPYSKLIFICRQYNVPTPPAGYWTRLEFNKDVSEDKIPLLGDGEEMIEFSFSQNRSELKRTEKQSPQKQENPALSNVIENTNHLNASAKEPFPSSLSFLEPNQQKIMSEEINSISIRENGKLHKALVEHKKNAFQQSKKIDPHMGYPSNARIPQTPFHLARQVSQEGMLRAYRILDAIYRSAERLGCEILNDFGIKITDETVYLEFKEMKDNQPHHLTKEEAKALVEYNDKKKNGVWYYSKPNIRKYDHVYNGRLTLYAGNKVLRDSPNQKIEDKLDLALIGIWEEYYILREKSIAREAARKAEEEAKRRKEEWENRCNHEYELIQQLLNESEDYRIARQLRDYINAVESNSHSTETEEWLTWAKEKADWFDPLLRREDFYLGIRSSDSNNRNGSYDIIKCESSNRHTWKPYWY